jgi:hypothetical protein
MQLRRNTTPRRPPRAAHWGLKESSFQDDGLRGFQRRTGLSTW